METNRIRRAKQRAKELSSKDGITHQQALDAVARQAGYAHWAEMLSAPTDGKIEQGGVDVLAHRWFAVSASSDRHVKSHFYAAPALLLGRERTVGSVKVLRILMDIAHEDLGEAMDGPSFGSWLERRISEWRDAPSGRPFGLLAEFVASRHPDIDECDLLASDDAEVFEGTMRSYSEAAALEGRLPADAIERLSLPSSGILAAVMTDAGLRFPLTDEEREAFVGACSSYGGDVLGRPMEILLGIMGCRSKNVGAVVGALRVDQGGYWLPSLGELVSSDRVLFPRSTRSGAVGAITPETVLSLAGREGPSLFLEWLADVVSKAGTASTGFSYNPILLMIDKGIAYPRERSEVVDVLALLFSGASTAHEVQEVRRVLASFMDVAEAGAVAGTLGEVHPRLVSGLTLDAVAALVDLAIEKGIGQVVLYGRISGASDETLGVLRNVGRYGSTGPLRMLAWVRSSLEIGARIR